MQGRKRESHSGAARQAHDEATAEKLLAAGLEALGIERDKLKELPKSAPEKGGARKAISYQSRNWSTVNVLKVGQPGLGK